MQHPPFELRHVRLGHPLGLGEAGKAAQQTPQRVAQPAIQLGLLLLIATPILRVAVSTFDFLRERDWLYVTVTLIVLAVLIYGLMSG